MPSRLTYVLIPGAWHGGWAWHPVAQRLRAAGHAAVALTLPGLGDGADPRGLGLQDAVAHVVSEVQRRDLRGVVLVGHSWGAFPATGAAHRLPGRIAKVVYFSAPVPTPGTSQNDQLSPENAEYARSLAQSTPDHTMALPFQAFQQVMMQDEPERAQRIVFDQLLPQRTSSPRTTWPCPCRVPSSPPDSAWSRSSSPAPTRPRSPTPTR